MIPGNGKNVLNDFSELRTLLTNLNDQTWNDKNSKANQLFQLRSNQRHVDHRIERYKSHVECMRDIDEIYHSPDANTPSSPTTEQKQKEEQGQLSNVSDTIFIPGGKKPEPRQGQGQGQGHEQQPQLTFFGCKTVEHPRCGGEECILPTDALRNNKEQADDEYEIDSEFSLSL